MKDINKLQITLAGSTHVGMVREKNEDSYLAIKIKPKNKNPLGIRAILAVADGMGGHVGGEEASSTAVNFVEEVFTTKGLYNLTKFDGDIKKAITAIIRAANIKITEIGKNLQKPPGTTFTGAFISGNTVYIGHIGDSRAYLIKNDKIIKITEDHSLVGKLVTDGKLTQEEAKDFPQKNVLLKSLGGGEPQEIDPPYEVNLVNGDLLLVCSDGLWNLVSDEEMLAAIHRGKNLKNVCNKLIKLAKMRGGNDNITVVVAEFGRLKRNRAIAKSFKHNKEKKTKVGIKKKRIQNIIKVAIILLTILFLFILWQIIKDSIKPEKIPAPETGSTVIEEPTEGFQEGELGTITEDVLQGTEEAHPPGEAQPVIEMNSE